MRARLLARIVVVSLVASFAVSTVQLPGMERNVARAAGSSTIDSYATFNGSNQYFQAPNNSIFDFTGNMTFSAWIRPTSTCFVANRHCTIAGKENAWLLSVWGGEYLFAVMGSSGWAWRFTGIKAIQGQWQHVSYVFTKTTNTVWLAINGRYVFTRTSSTEVPNPSLGSNAVFEIGARTGVANERFSGDIDEVRVYNVARATEAQAQADMNTWGPADASGLVLYYDFNEGSGTALNNTVTGAAAATHLTAYGSPTWSDVKKTTTDNGRTLVAFPRSYLTSAGGYTVPSGIGSYDYLVVAGGGGGGSRHAGGGGAGGYLTGTNQPAVPGDVMRVSVGGGGLGSVTYVSSNGADSVLARNGTVIATAIGGGGGHGAYGVNVSSGGSGGGSSFSGQAAGTGTVGQGNNGGIGGAGGNWACNGANTGWCGGGGGGAGGVGEPGDNGNNNRAGNGGVGLASSLLSTTAASSLGIGHVVNVSVFFAGGGGGGADAGATAGTGSNGGGGAGSAGMAGGATNGTASTGGGGGGGGYGSGSDPGGSGGTGVVLLSFATACTVNTTTLAQGGTQLAVTNSSNTTACTYTWRAPAGVSLVDSLIVGAGGGGGGAVSHSTLGGGGGGGAGGQVKRLRSQSVTANSDYLITIGVGGSGGTGSAVSNATSGSGGGSTTAFSTTSSGGNGGGGSVYNGDINSIAGDGGATLTSAGGAQAGGTNVWEGAGGGAGAGSPGVNGRDGVGFQNYGFGEVGGNGQLVQWYAGTCSSMFGGGGGGGGAGATGTSGTGGPGGGGNAATNTAAAVAGTNNCGGGGGGGYVNSSFHNGARGGNGVVVVRYNYSWGARTFATGAVTVAPKTSTNMGLGTSQVQYYTNGEVVAVQLTSTNGNIGVTLAGSTSVSAGANNSTDITIKGSQGDVNNTLNSATLTTDNQGPGQVTMRVSAAAQDQTINGLTFKHSNGHFYAFRDYGISSTKTVGQAAEDAQSYVMGGRYSNLATITNTTENTFLTGTVRTASDNIWIGLTDDIVENSFSWEAPDVVAQASTGSTSSGGMFVAWPGSVEPNNSNGLEDYVHLGTDGTWNDNSATAAFRYSLLEVEPTRTKKIFDVNYSIAGNTAVPSRATRIETPGAGDPIAVSHFGQSETIVVTVSVPAGSTIALTTTGNAVTAGASGTATVTFEGTRDNVNNALSTLTLTAGSAGTTTVTVTYRAKQTTVGNYKYNSATGTYYLLGSSASYSSAVTTATSQSFGGVTGFLATVQSDAERSFITANVTSGQYWANGRDEAAGGDATAESQWVMDGGDAYNVFSTESSAIDGAYTNWTGSEPSNGTEGCLNANFSTNFWNDATCSSSIAPVYEFKPYTVTYSIPVTVAAAAACVTTTSTSGKYTLQQVTATGHCDWTVPAGVTSVDTFIQGAGGGGGTDGGGGGSGGTSAIVQGRAVTAGGTVTVFVGDGGAGGTYAQNDSLIGEDSSVTIGGSTLTAAGGPGGNSGPSVAVAAASTAGIGFSGGVGGTSSTTLGSTGGAGKTGTELWWSGSSVQYGGGGGGGAYNNGAHNLNPAAGASGGGAGCDANISTNTSGSNGTANRGGGGGGGCAGDAGRTVGGTGGSGTVIFRYATDPLDAFPASIGSLRAFMTADSFQYLDSSRRSWIDTSGNSRHATTFNGSPSVTTVTGNGATETVRTLSGGTVDGLRFPTGFLSGSATNVDDYTFVHVARYSGTNKARIFDAVNVNWLSGFWANNAGVAFHNVWFAPNYQPTVGEFGHTNWVLSVDQNLLYRRNGGVAPSATVASATRSDDLTINYGNYSGERSDWNVAEVIVFSKKLSAAEIRRVESYLTRKYGLTGATASATSVPLTPTSLAVNTTGITASDRLNVTWAAPTDATGITDYTLEYKLSTDSSWSAWAHTASSSFLSATVTGLTANSQYDFRVTAVDSGASSRPPSAVVSGTTKKAPTVSLTPPSNPRKGQAATITANVTATATGTVTFAAGGTNITGCVGVAVSSSAATCSWTPAATGAASLTATYSGDSAFATGSTASASSVTVLNVACAPSTTVVGRYTVARFTDTSQTCDYMSLPAGVQSVDVLVVGGGGGGGENVGSGGGGGGGYEAKNIAATSSDVLTVNVGAGGRAGTAGGVLSTVASADRDGGPGGNSSISWNSTTLTGAGGGAGQTAWSDDKCNGATWNITRPSGGTGTGSGGSSKTGGQGGIGDRDGSTATYIAEAGGAGFTSDITGTTVTYGGGGGGGGWGTNGGAGGAGGGAAGGSGSNVGGAGSANTGGGGGGGNVACAAGGAGGSGIVVIRYANAPTITTQPVAQTVTVGTVTTFTVAAAATGATVTYQWQKNGVDITGATAASYSIASPVVGDAGNYKVIVSNTDANAAVSSVTSNEVAYVVNSTGVPGTPTSLTGTSGSLSADLTWTAPPSNGSAISGYVVQYSTNDGSTWTQATANTASATTSYTVTGLSSGTNYVFRVAAINSSGTGSFSAKSNSVTPIGTPGAPTSVSGVAGNQSVVVTWVAPTGSVGVISDYVVQYSSNSGTSWTTFSDGTSTSLTATVTGLTNGTSYVFRVAAVNGAGTGTYSTASSSVTPRTTPGQVTSVVGTSGNQSVSLSWSAPSSNGGSAITDYVVQYSSNSGTSWTTFSDGTSTSLSATVTGLTNGTSYVFQVAAVNAAGTGSYSTASAAVVPYTVPGAPTSVSGSPGNTQVSLSWSAPASNNGSAITDYVVQYSSNSGTSWTTFSDGTSTSLSATVTGLTNGTSYVFQVAAVNAAGTGSYSTASAAAVPYTVPSTPTSVIGAAGNQSVTVTWTAPASNGSAITDYVVQYSSNSGASWTTFSDGTSAVASATVTGLLNGIPYVFRVAAVNAAGAGSYSTASSSATPRSSPGQVTAVAGTADNQSVQLVWTAPSSNGGSAITDYVVQYSSNSGASWTTFTDGTSIATSTTVTGLTNGTSYVFQVSAVNVVGAGPYSIASDAVVPYTVPGAPTSVTGTPGNTQVALSWTAPASNGGNAVSDYVIEYSTNSGTTWITFSDFVSSATTATVTGLTNGSGYIFRVTAKNAAGVGTASSTSSGVVPRTVSSAVPSVTTTVGNTQIGLTWTLPVSTGGSAITDYLVEYSADGTTWNTFNDGVSSTRSTTVTGLTNGTTYSFRVSAINAAGTGPSSQATASIAPYTTPGQPTSVLGTFGDGQVSLTWTAPASNGGNAVSDYLVQWSSDSGGSWTVFTDSVSATTTATVTGLTNGSPYTFRVAAVNDAGTGSYSTASSAVTPKRIPGAPTLSTSTVGNTQVALTWSAPSSNGGATITDYAVQYSSNAGTSWSSASLVGSATTSYTVIGLTNGTQYVFRVAAVNTVGTGTYSSSSSASTPRTVPDAPTGVQVTLGNTQISLVWTAPASNGGSAITDYDVQWSSDGGSSWTTFIDGVSTSRAATVTGLTNGTEYVFRVRAVNVAGNSAYSVQSSGGTPRTSPSAPSISSITTGNASLSVNFVAADSGGTVISSYDYSTDGGVTWRQRSLGTTESPIVVTTLSSDGTSSLSNGTSYSVRIRAVNAAGPGSASATTVATPLTLPTVPLSLTTSPSSNAVDVSWTAPSNNGGAAISDYVIQLSTNNGTSWTTFNDGVSSSTTATVTGLTNGTPYVFRVAAVNSVGTSSYSISSASVTPRSAPSAPTNLSVTPGNGSLSVTWTAPTSGGSVITDYIIQWSSNSGTSWTTFNDGASLSTTEVISGLTNGTAYLVQVAAVNAAGTGTYATSASATTPRTVPSAPTLGVITPGSGSLSVAFTAGANGGSAITSYQYSTNGGSSWQTASGSTSPIVIFFLTNGTSYDVALRAVNVAGSGAASAIGRGVPRTVPSAPTISSITPSDASASVAFSVSSNGGAAVQNIEFSTDNGTSWQSSGVTTSPLVISGLTNGTSYSLRVRAVNVAGTSSASASSSITPFTSPGAPTISAIAGGIGTATVTFTAGSTGGSAITNYAYSTDNGSTWTTRSPASTSSPLTISGLGDGVRYSVKVRAINAAGSGTASDVASVLTKGVPAAPTISSYSQLDGALSLVVTPGANGGEAISNWAWSTNGGVSWTTRNPASANSTIVISALTNGTDYNVKVRAVNAVGDGVASAVLVTRPHTVPAAPTIASQVVGNQQVTLTITPAGNGGETITDYEYSTDRGATWYPRTDSGGASTSLLITALSSDGSTALTNGTTYDVQVRAVNSVGSGDESADITATPRTVPSAPTLTSITAMNAKLSAFFIPRSNGGAAITGYEYSTDGGVTWVAHSSRTSPLLITALSTDGTTVLTNGTSYDVKLRATNIVGAGTASSAISSTPHTTPGTPTVTSVTPGDGSIAVAFSEGGNGGATITSYDYSTDGGATWRTRAPGSTMVSSPITITKLSSDGLTSLANGTTYDVLIRAVNTAGGGVESATSSVIPSGLPSAPTITQVTPSDGALQVTFTAGGANGRAITANEFSIDGGTTWESATSINSPFTITGLANGTQYLVSVRHINANGTGAASVAVVGKPRTRASAPTLTSATSSDGSVTVNFTAPSSDGGDTITTYQYSTDSGATWSNRAFGTTETFLGISTLSVDGVTPLVNGTNYAIKLRAVNGAGGGVASDVLLVSPFTRPAAPVITSITPGDASADVAFTLSTDGGSALTNIEFSVDAGVTWMPTNGTTSPVQILGLTNGVTQSVTIRAVNIAGAGNASNAVTAYASGRPGAPAITSLTAGNATLTVDFTAGNENGAAVTNVEYSTDGGTTWTAPASPVTTSPLVITGLTNGTVYSTRIRAVNPNGSGIASDAVLSKPYTVPSAPAAATATPTTNKIKVVYEPPTSDGGQSIIGYEYSLDGGTTWVSLPLSSLREFTIENLADSSNYTVKLRAISAAGSGDMIAAQAATQPAPAPVVTPTPTPTPAVTPIATPVAAPVQRVDPVTQTPVRAPTAVTVVPSVVTPTKSVTKPKSNTSTGSSSSNATAQQPTSTPAVLPVPELAPSDTFGSSAGRKVDVKIETIADTSVRLSSGTAQLTVSVIGADNKPMPLDPSGHLVLRKSGRIALQVKQFTPMSEVRMYVYSTPTLVGTFTTDATGSLDVSAAVPSALELGGHTLEVRGPGTDGKELSLAIGVTLIEDSSTSSPESNTGSGQAEGTPTVADTESTNGTSNLWWLVILVFVLALSLVLIVRNRRRD